MRLRLAAILVIALSACGGEMADEEILRADEEHQAERGVANFERLVERYRTTHVARGAHAKGHACLKAELTVDPDLPSALRHGVFALPGQRYKAWVRFSNGHFDLDISADGERDARGMAIKLLEPPGDPLVRAANGPATQDFLLTNSPVFFARDIAAYNDLVAAPEDFLGYFLPGWDPREWRIREFVSALRTLGDPPVSLLDEQYFSVTPYHLGPHTVKYATRACTPATAGELPESVAKNYLASELAARLAEHAACFEFLVQRHRSGAGLSIEDPTVEWPEAVAPFEPVARLDLPKQAVADGGASGFCENLAFAPWHALPAHRPLGQFNRLRKHVYPASSNYRHAENGTDIPVQLDW